MPLAKVKSRKQQLRLKSRIEAWDKLSNKTGKSGRYAWTKPGSNKK